MSQLVMARREWEHLAMLGKPSVGDLTDLSFKTKEPRIYLAFIRQSGKWRTTTTTNILVLTTLLFFSFVKEHNVACLLLVFLLNRIHLCKF